jgi:hypothetical protein
MENTDTESISVPCPVLGCNVKLGGRMYEIKGEFFIHPYSETEAQSAKRVLQEVHYRTGHKNDRNGGNAFLVSRLDSVLQAGLS